MYLLSNRKNIFCELLSTFGTYTKVITIIDNVLTYLIIILLKPKFSFAQYKHLKQTLYRKTNSGLNFENN